MRQRGASAAPNAQHRAQAPRRRAAGYSDPKRAGRPYDQQDAERFARALLMPDEAFGPVVACSDLELAELLTVLDEVAARRRDGVTHR